MEEYKNLEDLTRDISDKLLDAMTALEILQDIIDGEDKEDFLLISAIKNIKQSFKNAEMCRKLISITD